MLRHYRRTWMRWATSDTKIFQNPQSSPIICFQRAAGGASNIGDEHMISSAIFRHLMALCLVGFATGALAQKVGTYSGTADDGSFVSFTVSKTGSTFSFTNGDVNFQAQCTKPDGVANEGWGFFLGQDIVNGDNPFHSGNDYYDIRGSMHFSNDNTIKGTLTSVTAVFVPGDDPPKKAHFCKSAKQGFTLKFQTAPQTPPVAPGTSVHHDR